METGINILQLSSIIYDLYEQLAKEYEKLETLTDPNEIAQVSSNIAKYKILIRDTEDTRRNAINVTEEAIIKRYLETANQETLNQLYQAFDPVGNETLDEYNAFENMSSEEIRRI